MKAAIAALFATTLLALAPGAQASTINIFSTGVDAAGNVVANGTPGDLHYTVTSWPAGAPISIAALTSASGYPITAPYWMGDDTLSRWIGPAANDAVGPAGTYRYRTEFTLTADQLANASLTGMFATDDSASILLNGVSKGIFATSMTTYAAYAINSGFVVGVNTLDFLVKNLSNDGFGGGPTGLRVQADAAPAVVPEPAPLALFGVALLGLVASRRKVR